MRGLMKAGLLALATMALTPTVGFSQLPGGGGGASITCTSLTYTSALGYLGVSYPVNVSTFTVSQSAVYGLERIGVSGAYSLNAGGNWRSEYAIVAEVTYGLAAGGPVELMAGVGSAGGSWLANYASAANGGVLAAKVKVALYQASNGPSGPVWNLVAVTAADIAYEQ